MKLLLDENLPRQVKSHLLEFEVYSVSDQKWNGKSNGELLQLMIKEGFNVFITADKNLQHQQNFMKYSIPVIILNVHRITYDHLKPLLPKLRKCLDSNLPNGPTNIS